MQMGNVKVIKIKKRFNLRTTAALALTSLLSAASFNASADVILHAFNWKYEDVEQRAQEIAQLCKPDLPEEFSDMPHEPESHPAIPRRFDPS